MPKSGIKRGNFYEKRAREFILLRNRSILRGFHSTHRGCNILLFILKKHLVHVQMRISQDLKEIQTCAFYEKLRLSEELLVAVECNSVPLSFRDIHFFQNILKTKTLKSAS